MKPYFRIILFFISLFSVDMAFAQEKVELVRADELEGSGDTRKLRGNVVFKQQDTFMYCDSAYQYPGRNSLDAFGNVRIQQGDTVTLTGRTLNYNGNTRKALVKGNVVFRDRTMTLTTDALDYDLNKRIASYTTGGTIKDGNSTLTSRQGFYNSRTKMFFFRRNVKVVNPTEGFTLTSDSLNYNTTTKIVTFQGPTVIESKDGVVHATEGEYNTASSVSDLKSRSTVVSGTYTLEGDKLSFDEKRDAGVVTGNVNVYSKQDNVVIVGDKAHYWGKQGITKVFGNAVMKKAMEGGDTLLLKADTLISIDPAKFPELKRLIAFPHAKIYKSDLQGICDSLTYNFSDSTIYFFGDPVLWNENSQILADSIDINLVNNKMHKMNMRMNAFMISRDSVFNYNQVKGKNMTAYFVEDNINKVDVSGNGECLYFALEEETNKLIGMNKVECSDMVLKFNERKVNSISFLTKPDALFVPPHEIKEPDKRLKGFKWRIQEKPTKEMILN